MPNGEDLGKDRLIWMYTQMVRIREFEEHVKRTFLGIRAMRGQPTWPMERKLPLSRPWRHAKPTDLAMPSYRCHAQPIVLGTPPRKSWRSCTAERRAVQGIWWIDAPGRSDNHFPVRRLLLARVLHTLRERR